MFYALLQLPTELKLQQLNKLQFQIVVISFELPRIPCIVRKQYYCSFWEADKDRQSR